MILVIIRVLRLRSSFLSLLFALIVEREHISEKRRTVQVGGVILISAENVLKSI